VELFGPADGGGRPVPEHCPVSDHSGEEDVLCPFAFWGLSCVLEQPPSAAWDAASVVSTRDLPVSLLVATGSGLAEKITVRHLTALQSVLGDAVTSPRVGSDQALADLLADERMDVAYLYCHGAYQQVSARAAPTVYLLYGGEKVGPLDINKWAEARWPDPHWPSRKPLVVLNGCHTAEATSGTLATFVSAFVGDAGAAGMIGTEVALEQGLASIFMEYFLTRFIGGTGVGNALRDARWHLLGVGNVMGLAYTPYCLSSLRIRANEESAA